MQVAVTGPRGQVGRELVALGAVAVDDDVTKLERIDARAVIHCAAYTDVDGCERDPERAMRVNGEGTANVVASTDGFVVYVSTDYVFDGTKTTPYVESDEPNPLSMYGASKLAGEHAIDVTRHAIVRVSWVCGGGNNLVRTIARLLDGDGTLRFVTDQRSCLTLAPDLAPALLAIARDRKPGIYHVTNQGALTPYELARAVARTMGHDEARVEPALTADLPPRPARRPANAVLGTEVVPEGARLPPWSESLPRYLTNLRQSPHQTGM
jgi:dTDP-4-dehydrorhamnose reductase